MVWFEENFHRLLMKPSEMKDAGINPFGENEVKEEVKKDEEDGGEDIAILEFVINKEGQMMLNIKWRDFSEQTLEYLAALLYTVNSRNFKEEHSNILLSTATQSSELQLFVEKVLEKWKNREKRNAMIKPSSVFGITRIRNE